MENDSQKTVILINTLTFGSGDKALGEKLLYNFIFTLTESKQQPATIIFLNEAVYAVAKNSPHLENLQNLLDKGVDILSCGTCLDFYHLKEQVAVGSISNMYDIAENLLNADKVIKL